MINGLGRFVITALVLMCLSGAVWAQSNFFFVESGDEVVLRYTRTPGELAGSDTSTVLTVFGSGRAIVHYPPYGKRKGDYEMMLSRAELNELVATVVNYGVLEYDEQAVNAEQNTIMQADNIGFYTGDADISTIEVRLASYSPEGVPVRFDVQRAVSPSALQSRASHFDTIQSLVDLAAVERQFIKLINSDEFSPFNPAE